MDFEIITIASQQYRVAGWASRIVARLLDVALVTVGGSVAGVCLARLLLELDWLQGDRAAAGKIAGVLVTLAGIAYLLIGSGLMKGASLGKRLVGLKIIDARYGGPCSLMQDLLRQCYLLYGNPVFLAFTAYDSARDNVDQPQTHIVHATPLTSTEMERQQDPAVPPAKPARLDLAGMQQTLQKLRAARGGSPAEEE